MNFTDIKGSTFNNCLHARVRRMVAVTSAINIANMAHNLTGTWIYDHQEWWLANHTLLSVLGLTSLGAFILYEKHSSKIEHESNYFNSRADSKENALTVTALGAMALSLGMAALSYAMGKYDLSSPTIPAIISLMTMSCSHSMARINVQKLPLNELIKEINRLENGYIYLHDYPNNKKNEPKKESLFAHLPDNIAIPETLAWTANNIIGIKNNLTGEALPAYEFFLKNVSYNTQKQWCYTLYNMEKTFTSEEEHEIIAGKCLLDIAELTQLPFNEVHKALRGSTLEKEDLEQRIMDHINLLGSLEGFGTKQSNAISEDPDIFV